MSFLGIFGAIIKGPGLEDLLFVVYAENSGMHMLSGKQYLEKSEDTFL